VRRGVLVEVATATTGDAVLGDVRGVMLHHGASRRKTG
jgi:hypothetical protein